MGGAYVQEFAQCDKLDAQCLYVCSVVCCLFFASKLIT